MPFFNRPRTGKPFVDRLMDERDHIDREVRYLREEINTLNQIVAHKYLCLSQLNKKISQRSYSDHYLQLIHSTHTELPQQTTTRMAAGTRQKLRCINGGKPMA